MTDLYIKRKASLSEWNTFGFNVTADQLVIITEADQLIQLESLLQDKPQPLLVLGGGSNLVLSDHLPGIVARMAIKRWEARVEGDDVLLWAGAGESWHQTVERSLKQGWYGLENLALIPGTVGAAPIQNIGAYGVELKDRLTRVEVFDREQLGFRLLDRDDCCFGYRDSLFKSQMPGRYIITAVEFRLSRKPSVQIGYAGLQAELEEQVNPTPEQVFDAVCRVRRRKLPSPDVLGNAGSFFKNPVVTAEQCQSLHQMEPGLVSFPDASGGYKLAAGWLIDRCGLKGYRQGSVGTYSEQALVLVNLGGGDRQAVEHLAAHIQREVRERFGVELEPEPRFYP
ncbi:UDP-N-acetylmuramate dehydrogenase [Marinobacterium sediminicola]|uniref:UDP-N-acetylenolpyruvoylglucosamine reductase n=1 Tax=Marinobacterium sediminicola TaxID=518898 RepID=A0ABY1RX51_9GAMM|nr:UDP-N-acetylmuramate dehydrogenase [Marinobacterium sediminicola]ULG67837.1 UDP-N-acetylmuramate dehydrogenase [Marinobacterium sediminicola]SMR71482.1 UDP-N-acetylmuramate dehydrogenase [Marinobacterium sediminicola]